MTKMSDGSTSSYPLRDCRLRNDEGFIDSVADSIQMVGGLA